MAVISAIDARNFFEVSILLKDATPSVTWYGSPAMQNGSEQRSLNDCIKIIDKVTQAARTTNWSSENEIMYKIAKCATKIQELSNETRHLIEAKQVNIFTRICYYVQACFSWIFGTPEANVAESLQNATNVNGTVDSIRQHLSQMHVSNGKQVGYRHLKEAIENCDSGPQATRFMEMFEELVPEDKRSREILFACAQMELLHLEEKGENDLWESYLMGLLDGDGHLLPSTPAMLSFLLSKVGRWGETSAAANERWIEPLQKRLGIVPGYFLRI